MNNFTLLQRKLIYLCGMIVLFIPIIMLGLPGGAGADSQSGGYLSRLRARHDLGEEGLGQVDPTSAAMNLVLLGLRGVATNLLWMEADEQKDHKNWAQLKVTVESIVRLQPHYIKVWNFQGWNLAYNVSAEWDAVEDRFYWVKEGIKFYKKGTQRNRRHPELYWYTGDTIDRKIGRSDEKMQFRKFFRSDPDKRWHVNEFPGPDREINLDAEDNFVVAKRWFQRAVDVSDENPEPRFRQHISAPVIFRSYPARAQFDLAQAYQDEGLFGEKALEAWRDAYTIWTESYGLEPITFQVPLTGERLEIQMEVDSDEEFQRLAEKNNVSVEIIRNWVHSYQRMVKYRSWRTRASVESQPNTAALHQEFYLGQQKFLSGDHLEAKTFLESGMDRFQTMIDTYPELLDDDTTKDQGILVILMWRKIQELAGESVELDKLQKFWKANRNRVPFAEYELNYLLRR